MLQTRADLVRSQPGTCAGCVAALDDEDAHDADPFNIDPPARVFHCCSCGAHLECYQRERLVTCPSCRTDHNSLGQPSGWTGSPSRYQDETPEQPISS